MLHMIKIISLAAALVLGTVFNASAATKHGRVEHRRVVHIYPLPSSNGAPPILSNACPPVPPCRTPRDDW
jgi:hypothetical protein